MYASDMNAPLKTAELVADRYRVLDVLGHGGVGTVYKAIDERLNRIVALKMFHTRLEADSTVKWIFEHEARTTALLSHPGIVHIYDVGESNAHYLVTEYVNGLSLKRILTTQVKLKPAQALAILRPVAEALAYAHKQGVVHLDIKPSNILITRAGRVLVSDFGLARVLGSRDYEEGIIAGTVAYMSPEQFAGRDLDQRFDVFSLGVVLYEALTGSRPFERTGYPGAESQETPVITLEMADVPILVQDALRRALDTNLETRLESMELFVNALEEAESHIRSHHPVNSSWMARQLRQLAERPTHHIDVLKDTRSVEHLIQHVLSPELSDDTQIHDVATVSAEKPVPQLFKIRLLSKRSDTGAPLRDLLSEEPSSSRISSLAVPSQHTQNLPSIIESSVVGTTGATVPEPGNVLHGQLENPVTAPNLHQTSSFLTLLISGPEGISRKVELGTRAITLGRSADNELAYPDDPWLSRYHLAIECKQNEWFVRDCASRNGTYLNSMILKEPQKFKAGDRISAGHLTIEIADPHVSTEIVSFVPHEAGGSLRGATIVTNLDKVLSKTVKAAHEPHETPLNTLRTVQALIRAGQELAGHQSLDELFSVILQLALSAMGSKRGVILTLEGEELVVRASKGEEFVISTAVRDRVIREKCSLVISDAQADDALKRQQSIVMHRVRSMIAVPLQTGDRVIGLIYVDNGGNVLRPFQQEDVDLLTVMANVAAIRIEHARLAEVEQTERLIASELAQASEIQQSLLPISVPELPGIDVARYHLPCRTVGGDYHDFFPHPDGRLGIAIADISGKGLPAAIMMATLQARTQTLMEESNDISDTLTRLNRIITGRKSVGKFFTVLLCDFDPNTGILTYANAGFNYPLLIKASGTIEKLPGSEMVLGILPNVFYKKSTTQLNVGDILVLFTDGMSETYNPQGEEFGEERIGEIISKHRERSAQEIMNALIDNLRSWRVEPRFADDITALIIRRVSC